MGQAKKKRTTCPATGNPIQPTECGTKRMSQYACPESCPQNPWSVENYDRQLEIDNRQIRRSTDRLVEETFRTGRLLSPPSEEVGTEFALLSFYLNHFFRNRDAQGTTFFERWEKENFSGLNNDQAILLKCQANFFPAVVEVLQVIDDKQVLVVDRLNPDHKPILVVDRSLAERACRFTTLFTFLYKTPFFYRVQSAAKPLPDIVGMDAEEIVLEVVRHHNGPTEKVEFTREWLSENVNLVVDSLTAIITARQVAMYRSLDAVYTKSLYQLNAKPSAVVALLATHPDIQSEELIPEDDDEGVVLRWVWTLESSSSRKGRTILCSILLHKGTHICLNTSSAKRRDEAKPLFEKLLGDTVSFISEGADDLAMQLLQQRRLFYDAKLVPEKLLEEPTLIETSQTCLPPEYADLSHDEILQKAHESFLRDYPDQPVPALDGKTPRQAADDPALRPVLLRMMKNHVHSYDEEDLKNGTQTEINGLLRELKLDEIIFPPPPLRNPPPEDDEWDEEDQEYEAFMEEIHERLILTPEEVEFRMGKLNSEDQNILVQDFISIYPEAYALLQEEIFDGEYKVKKQLQPQILSLVAKIAFLFFLPGQNTPKITREELADALGYVTDEWLNDNPESDAAISSQPHVLDYTAQRLGEITGSKVTKSNLGPLLFIASLVEELHFALYERATE